MSRLRQAVRITRKRLTPVSLILMYHRVEDVKTDPWLLCVTPKNFSGHLEVLHKMGCSLRLEQLVKSLQQGKIPMRSIVITFDDGYADNLYTAKPLLEHFNIPATFFITTGSLERRREFWWDELERLIFQPPVLPEALSLSIHGKTHEWHLGNAALFNEDSLQQHSSWKAWEAAPTVRHEIYYSLWQLLKPLDESEIQHILDQLLTWSGATSLIRPTHRPLQKEEISLLAKGDLFDIGAHSATHASLPLHSAAFQQTDIYQSKVSLERLLGHPVTSFSYPYGSYGPDTVAIVQDSGFSCACSTHPHNVFIHTDRFQLPRLEVLDWKKEEFKEKLLQWFSET